MVEWWWLAYILAACVFCNFVLISIQLAAYTTFSHATCSDTEQIMTYTYNNQVITIPTPCPPPHLKPLVKPSLIYPHLPESVITFNTVLFKLNVLCSVSTAVGLYVALYG